MSMPSVLGVSLLKSLDRALLTIPIDINTSMTETVRADEAMYSAISQRHAWNGGGFGEPRDVANVVLFLASEENTWMTGAAIPVDGAYTTA
jgi:NAD(P)-dependent dehydrogenase (short-subunit alcohol dehydrogenase family)